MPEILRRLSWGASKLDEPELLKQEWLVTNGLGG
jgi:hypothetical protein